LSDAVLIDRGDLSRQVPLEQIPAYQKDIIRRAKAMGRAVLVATNLLESMVHSLVPTLAEINDIYNRPDDGADGLVLAAETAVGKFRGSMRRHGEESYGGVRAQRVEGPDGRQRRRAGLRVRQFGNTRAYCFFPSMIARR
jgi:hypothetical protein